MKVELISITKEDREKIKSIFMEDDVRIYDDQQEPESLNYFCTKLDDDTDDCFYDHSTPIAKIFKELQCVPTGFVFDNDYYEKGDVNTYYGIWFSKLKITNTIEGCDKN